MKNTTLIAILGMIVLGSGCSNVKSIRITAANQGNIWGQIKNTHSLTPDETRLLLAYQMRTGMAAAFSGRQGKGGFPVGKTIGQIIDEERQFERREQQKEANADHLAAKARADAERERAALRNALSVAVFDKGYQQADFQSYITIGLVYQNHSGKVIRGFKGTIVFRTLFGDVIEKIGLEEDTPIKAGETKRVWKTTDFNQFEDADVRLRSTDLKNMKVEWDPEEILFADGTNMNASEAASE